MYNHHEMEFQIAPAPGPIYGVGVVLRKILRDFMGRNRVGEGSPKTGL